DAPVADPGDWTDRSGSRARTDPLSWRGGRVVPTAPEAKHPTVKFLCDQCKAKYQISDDKVAGKTVRMKCRKCGHLIEVRAAVTESSVATSIPAEPPAAGGSGKPPPPKPSGLPKSPLATSLAQAKPPVPRPAGKPEGGLSTAFKSS